MTITATFPVSRPDLIVYRARPAFGSVAPKFLLWTSGRLDEQRLRQAVRLSFDAEPILGCRLAKRGFRYLWQRRTDLDAVELCRVVPCADFAAEVGRFLIDPIDPTTDPLVRVTILRGKCDAVCIKIAHEVADGPSAKDYVRYLVHLYRQLKFEPGFRPEPNPTSVRSLDHVVRAMSLRDKARACWRALPLLLRPLGTGQWRMPWPAGDIADRGYVLLTIPPQRLQALKEYGWARRATITALLLAGFCHALLKIARPVRARAIGLNTFIDLRRFLGSEHRLGTPSNLITMAEFFLGGRRDRTFDQVVATLMPQLSALADGNYILASTVAQIASLPAAALRWAWNQWRAKQIGAPPAPVASLLVNFGELVLGAEDVEEMGITDAVFLGNCVHQGGLFVSGSEYCGTMTLSIGYCAKLIAEPQARQLLEELDRALPCGTGAAPQIRSLKVEAPRGARSLESCLDPPWPP